MTASKEGEIVVYGPNESAGAESSTVGTGAGARTEDAENPAGISPFLLSKIEQLVEEKAEKKVAHLTRRVKDLEEKIRDVTINDNVSSRHSKKDTLITWHQTGSGHFNNYEGTEEGVAIPEADDDFSADNDLYFNASSGRYSVYAFHQLPQDIYTVLATKKMTSISLWLSLLIVAVQFTLLTLLLMDTLRDGTKDNPLGLPSNVETIVHIAQALAIIIALLTQDDLRIGVESLIGG